MKHQQRNEQGRPWEKTRYQAKKDSARASEPPPEPPKEELPPPASPKVYDDTDVCRLLGIRRRVLVARRKAAPRGSAWDVVGEHVGMTENWIKEWNCKAAVCSLKPVEKGDGIHTLEVIAKTSNIRLAVCRVIADGRTETVGVPDNRTLYIGDQFDAKKVGKRLEYVPEINVERY